MDVEETEVRNDCAGEAEPKLLVESFKGCSCEKWEAGTWGLGQFGNPEERTSAIESRYQVTASKDWEDFMCAVVTVIFGVCNSVRLSQLFIVKIV
jgi:hypothetical protein